MESLGEDGFTALHLASFYGNLKSIEALIAAGADPHATNRQGINMLIVAAQGDQPLSIAYFTKNLGDKNLDINSTDNLLGTALHWAAFSGSEITISYLLAWKANIHARNIEGETPLFSSVKAFK